MNKMLSYQKSGFSLDAKVKVEAWDKDGLREAHPLLRSTFI